MPAALILLCPATVLGAVQVDGFFGEWEGLGGPGARLGEGADLTVEVRCARDGERLHLAVGARDDRFVPTPSAGIGGDRVALSFGEGGGARVEVLPGDLEDRMPTARGLRGVTVDGATRPHGWILEIGVPEAALIEAGAWRPAGVAIQVEVTDDDGPAAADGPDPGRPSGVAGAGRIDFAAGKANLDAWLAEAGAGAPARELLADVGGDGRPEWIVAAGSVLGVLGEGLGDVGLGGEVLPFADQGAIVALEARRLDGDDKAELVVRQTIATPTPGVEQEILYVYAWSGQGLDRLLAVEVAQRGEGWAIENSVRIGKPGRAGAGRGARAAGSAWADVVVTAGRARGVGEATYRDPDAGAELPFQPLLLPWGFARKARYSYQDGRYFRR